MTIEYCKKPNQQSVYDLIESLESMINNNPDIDFSEVTVFLNSEYEYSNVKLDTWKHLGKDRVAVDIY